MVAFCLVTLVTLWSFISAADPQSLGTTFFSNEPNDNVYELISPLQLKQYIDSAGITNGMEHGPCSQSRLLLLYASTCPHCQVFRPVWASVGRLLGCKGNEERLQIAEFECMTDQISRSNDISEWQRHFNQSFTQYHLADDLELISPKQICISLIEDKFPTLALATNKGCRLNEPWIAFGSNISEIPWNSIFSPDIQIYHFDLRPGSAFAQEIATAMTNARLAVDCDPSSTIATNDNVSKLLLEQIHNSSLKNPPNSRWTSEAQKMDPKSRYYDGILGLYHILGSWVFSGTNTLSEDHITTIANVLLLAGSVLPSREDRIKAFQTMDKLRGWGTQTTPDQWSRQLRSSMDLSGIPVPNNLEAIQEFTKLCGTPSCTVWTFFHLVASLQHLRKTIVLTDKTLATTDVMGNSCIPIYKSFTREDVVDWRWHLSTSERLTSLCVSGSNTAKILHNAVFVLFNCESCQQHFHDMYINCPGRLCEWLQNPNSLDTILLAETPQHAETFQADDTLGLLLWVWRVHNIVNVRTATTKAMQDLRGASNLFGGNYTFKNEDVRIPTLAMCPACRRTSIPAHSLTPQWMLKFIEANEQEDKMDFDVYEDFQISETSTFLDKFYTEPSWWLLESMQWDDEAHDFITSAFIVYRPVFIRHVVATRKDEMTLNMPFPHLIVGGAMASVTCGLLTTFVSKKRFWGRKNLGMLMPI